MSTNPLGRKKATGTSIGDLVYESEDGTLVKSAQVADFPKEIKAARNNMSQGDFAKIACCSVADLKAYESGKRVVPPDTMKRIRTHANRMGRLKKQSQSKTPESDA